MSITTSQLERIQHIVTPAADELKTALYRDPRGRRGIDPRIYLVGLGLSLFTKGQGTTTGAHRALKTQLSREQQWRIGFRYGPGPKDIVAKDKFDTLVKRMGNVLEYGEQRRPELTDEERQERRLLAWQLSQAFIRTTLIPRPEGSAGYAVDGTGLDAFERPPRKPKDLPDPDGHEEDVEVQPQDVPQEVKECAVGRGSKGRSDSKHGHRSDGGERKIYYGKDCEALVRVPMAVANGKRSEPALLEALEVLPASTDVVDLYCA